MKNLKINEPTDHAPLNEKVRWECFTDFWRHEESLLATIHKETFEVFANLAKATSVQTVQDQLAHAGGLAALNYKNLRRSAPPGGRHELDILGPPSDIQIQDLLGTSPGVAHLSEYLKFEKDGHRVQLLNHNESVNISWMVGDFIPVKCLSAKSKPGEAKALSAQWVEAQTHTEHFCSIGGSRVIYQQCAVQGFEHWAKEHPHIAVEEPKWLKYQTYEWVPGSKELPNLHYAELWAGIDPRVTADTIKHLKSTRHFYVSLEEGYLMSRASGPMVLIFETGKPVLDLYAQRGVIVAAQNHPWWVQNVEHKAIEDVVKGQSLIDEKTRTSVVRRKGL